jgi:hypothetical protein
MFQGCLLTQSYTKNLRSRKHFEKEFANFPGRNKVFEGKYVGDVDFKGVSAYHLQFAQVLDGENRILNLYCDPKNAIYPRIFETTEMKAGSPAFIYINQTSDFEEKDFRNQLFYQNDKLPETPDTFLTNINFDKTKISETLIVLDMDFGSVFSVPVTMIVWNKDSDGKYSVSRNYSFLEKAPYPPKLKWKKRNKLIFGLMNLGYAVVVPFDILTCPLQLFFLRGMVK